VYDVWSVRGVYDVWIQDKFVCMCVSVLAYVYVYICNCIYIYQLFLSSVRKPRLFNGH